VIGIIGGTLTINAQPATKSAKPPTIASSAECFAFKQRSPPFSTQFRHHKSVAGESLIVDGSVIWQEYAEPH
jgi:hypothetical protein